MKSRARKGRTMLLTPAEQQAAHNQQIIDDFNRNYPVGSKCWYWSTLPFGPVKETTIRGLAWFLPCGEPVCMVSGVSGGVSIWHISEINENRRGDIQFTCPTCYGTGGVDSGGVTPWGSPIDVPCPECSSVEKRS